MISLNDIWRYGPLFILALTVSVSVSVGGISVGLVYLAALGVLVQERKRIVLPAKSVFLAIGALLGAYFLATLLSMPYPHHWGKFGEELWIKLLVIAVPVVAGGGSRKIAGALKLALVIGAVASAYAVVQHFLGVDPIRNCSLYRRQFGHSAVSGFFSHHLSFAGQSLIFIIMTAAWYLDKPTDSRRRWLLLPLVALVLALVWSYARSAWVGVLVGLPVLVMLQSGRARWLAMAGGLVAAAAVLLIHPVRDHFLRIFQIQQHVTRLNLWQSSWDGIVANPLLGFGPGNFKALLDGFKVPGHYDTLAHSHHDLLMHGVNAGFPGILAALALLWVTCRLMMRASKLSSEYLWIFKGTLATQLGITVAGFFQVFQTDDEVEILLYFILGCAVALAGNLETREDHPQSRV